MAETPEYSSIIEDNPIGGGLDAFRAFFASICKNWGVPCSPASLGDLPKDDIQDIASSLASALRILPAASLLRSRLTQTPLGNDLRRFISSIDSDGSIAERTRPLLDAVLHNRTDVEIWNEANKAIAERTPPPPHTTSSVQDTPYVQRSSGILNSSEHRSHMDDVLRCELKTMYIDLDIHEIFFKPVERLEAATKAVFKECIEGSEPLFDDGWVGWPKVPNQDDVLSWLTELTGCLAGLATNYFPNPSRRQLFALPNKPLQGSKADRKLDIGFMDQSKIGTGAGHHWASVLVPGELKKNPQSDNAAKVGLDLGRYTREVFANQPTRRFVLGFTLCGPWMRLWEFDRCGAIGSSQFNVNENGEQLVLMILGCLWMREDELGFDPTIMTSDGNPGKRYIKINRDGQDERVFLDRRIAGSRSVVGRGTTIWKGHSERQPDKLLVVKDSWQDPLRGDEGELLRQLTEQQVGNVARHYHHYDVEIAGQIDDVCHSVRKGVDVATGKKIVHDGNRARSNSKSQSRATSVGTPQRDSSHGAGAKRSSSQTGALEPARKRSRCTSATKNHDTRPPNRTHRRVILGDYGIPIHQAKSHHALLESIADCIEGHRSAYKLGILHRDVSINNILIGEQSAFLIDFDHSVRLPREALSGAKERTGTQAFMAIGVLLGERHSFMDDLESFFWVLIWICIHYISPKEHRVVDRFEKWNYVQDPEELAGMKLGIIADDGIFDRTVAEFFTDYYKPLTSRVKRLRKVVFLDGRRWKKEDLRLYDLMRDILLSSQDDIGIQ